MRKEKIMYESDTLKVVKRNSNGRTDPSHIRIILPQDERQWPRVLNLTIDELFDLAEVLDDICDSIEDRELDIEREKTLLPPLHSGYRPRPGPDGKYRETPPKPPKGPRGG